VGAGVAGVENQYLHNRHAQRTAVAFDLNRVSGLWAYPIDLATLPALYAFTASYFFRGKSRQNRWLLHPALRCATGPLLPAPFGAIAAYDLLRQVFISRLRLRRRVLRTWPLQAPPLGLLTSQFLASELTRMKSESKKSKSSSDL